MFTLSILFWFVVFGALFVLALFDYRTQLIPDILLLISGGMVFAFIATQGTLGQLLWHTGAAVGFAALFYSVWAVSKGQWIGFADGKLAVVIGLLFGVSQGFTALAVSFWAGAAVCLSVMLYSTLRYKNHLHLNTAVPFGPFMVFGIWYVFITGINLFSLTL